MLRALPRLGGLAATALLMLLALVFVAGAAAASPTNDDYAQPIVVSGTTGSVDGSNVDATVQADEPVNDYGWSNATVWYAWTAPSDGHVSFEADADPLIPHVCAYAGATAATATSLTCGDDGVDLDVTAGTTYHVSVDGLDVSGITTGDFYFVWNFTGSSAPANDNWAYATPISDATGSVTGTTAGATMEAGEPSSPSAGHTVWFHWIAPQDGIVSFSADGGTVAAYTGTYLGGLTPLAGGGVVKGDVLSIRVDGPGPFTLSWQTAPPTAPQLTVPATIAVDATAPQGRLVMDTVSAVDWAGRALSPTCDADAWNGLYFAIGTTTVTCTVVDAGGRSASASFDVHVRGVPEQLTALEGAVAAASLDAKLTDKLTAKLADAQKQFAGGRLTAACSGVAAFLDTVQKNAGSAITTAQAESFQADASRIRLVLTCA